MEGADLGTGDMVGSKNDTALALKELISGGTRQAIGKYFF